MIVLGTGESIVAVLAAAPAATQPDYSVSSGLHTSGFDEGGEYGALNGTSEVTIVAAPASGKKLVRQIGIYNGDTGDVIVEVKLAYSTDRYTLRRELLAPGESLLYNKEWRIASFGEIESRLLIPPSLVMNSINIQFPMTQFAIHAIYLGRASRKLSSMKLRWIPGTYPGGPYIYYQVGVYKGEPIVGSGPTLTRVGYADADPSDTIKEITGSVRKGDGLWAAICWDWVEDDVTPFNQYGGFFDDLQTGLWVTYIGPISSVPGPTAFNLQAANLNQWWVMAKA